MKKANKQKNSPMLKGSFSVTDESRADAYVSFVVYLIYKNSFIKKEKTTVPHQL